MAKLTRSPLAPDSLPYLPPIAGVRLAAAQAGMTVKHYSATQIKKVLTGNGRAPKSQIQNAIRHELQLAEVPDPPDVADALAIAVCHYYLDVRRSLIHKKPA